MSAYDYEPDKPWNRQPCDSAASWAVFHRFLMQAVRPRSLRALVKEGAPFTLRELEEVAYQDGWQLRAGAWDRDVEQDEQTAYRAVKVRAAETAAERMVRQADLARTLQDLASASAKALETVQKRQPEFPSLTPREFIRAADVGVKLERLVMGDATERTETTEMDLSALSVDELREWRRLLGKAKGQAA